MSVWTLAGTIAASVLASVGGVTVLFRYGGDFLLERTKAKWSRELEAFKDPLNAEQRRYQAQLDRSIFVSRAHFDTELQRLRKYIIACRRSKSPFEDRSRPTRLRC